MIGVIALITVILAIPVWATDTPDYCGSCKATGPAAEAWKTSTHAKVSCVSCHVPPGTTASIRWRAREWLNIWADYLNVPQRATSGSRPGSENCLTCHSLNRIPEESNGVRMPHQLHVEMRNLTCADCHDQVAHPGPGQSGTGISMTVCSMCHHKDGAPAECTTCHLTPPPRNVHPKDYLETHGEQASANPESCLRCHHNEAEFCDPCHSRPTPDHFSDAWRYDHGKTAARDPEGCTGCHDKGTFCEQCHRVQHPDDWTRSHAAVAAESGRACLVCHPRSMCDRCHEQRGVKLSP